MRRRSGRLIAGLTVLGLIAGACSDDSGNGDSTAAPTLAPPSMPGVVDTTGTVGTTGGSRGEETDLDAAIQHALAYTAGRAGPADGEPLVIGYVNQEGADPTFAGATVGLEAAVATINEELGGVDGHPIEIRQCIAATFDDGTRCAQEMLADASVPFVITGAFSEDSIVQPLYDTLTDQKPVFIGSPSVTPDFLATDGFAFTPGPPGVIQGIAIFAARHLPGGVPDSIAVLHADTSAGQVALNLLTKPVLEALGIATSAIVGVPIGEDASTAAVATALQSAGATNVDVVIVLLESSACAAVAQAFTELDTLASVVAAPSCLGTPMTEVVGASEAGQFPDGWYLAGDGFNYFMAGTADIDSFVTLVGRRDHIAGALFATVLTVTRLATEIGFDSVTAESMRAAAQAFAGPQWGVAGPMACGAQPVFVSLCGAQVGVQQFTDGAWVSINDGYLGNPIDPSVELAP